jgi:hypothetical protein
VWTKTPLLWHKSKGNQLSIKGSHHKIVDSPLLIKQLDEGRVIKQMDYLKPEFPAVRHFSFNLLGNCE